jgi:two-component system NtrC family sensor kinase
MMDPWQARFERERAARREAESLLHAKSRELYETNRSLEVRAADLAASLEQLHEAQDQLIQREKMAALGGLVAGVAHEINTPLGVAVTAVTHTEDRLRALEATVAAGTLTRGGMRSYVEELREAVALALTNLERAARLVDSFKKVAVDQSSETPRECVLEELVLDVLASLRPLTRRAQVEVRLEATSHTQVRTDAGALVQVLTNLVQNACVHAFDESHAARIVTVAVTVTGEAVCMIVGDNGRGMPADVAARVFEPFFTTRRSAGGSGLGMHITHTLVTGRFFGTIDPDTAPGRGTQWTLCLPFGTAALTRQKDTPDDHAP